MSDTTGWKLVTNGPETHRLQVPGGWIYMTCAGNSTSQVFVPFAKTMDDHGEALKMQMAVNKLAEGATAAATVPSA